MQYMLTLPIEKFLFTRLSQVLRTLAMLEAKSLLEPKWLQPGRPFSGYPPDFHVKLGHIFTTNMVINHSFISSKALEPYTDSYSYSWKGLFSINECYHLNLGNAGGR